MDAVATDVLIVDDDVDLRQTIVEALTVVGYRVDEAANGAEALEVLGRRRPALVLLDLMMPVMDGWQFRFRQQQRADLAQIPVVLLSAAVGLDAQARSLQPRG